MNTRCALMFLVLAMTSIAANANDWVELTNGNRLSGTIRELGHGKLSFDIDDAGPVDIDWRNVADLYSESRFYVEDSAGARHIGTLSSRDGALIVATGSGLRTLPAATAIRIQPASGVTAAERLSGSIDLGFEFLSANDTIDWTLNAKLAHRTTNYLTEASLASLLRRANDATAQRRHRFDLGSRRFLERRWFVLGRLIAEEDRELDLDSRYLLGASIGRTLIQSNAALLASFVGFDADRETFRGFDTDTVWEMHVGIEWDLFEIATDTALEVRSTAYYAPDRSRTRLDLEAEVRHDIYNDFYLSLYVYESYNSDPPGDLESSDLGVAFTFGRSF